MPKQMTDEWGTPASVYNLIPKGGYFDPCPSKNQPKVHIPFPGIVLFSEQGRNGLSCVWSGISLVNPPYSDCQPWVDKAIMELKLFGNQTIMILPAYVDRKWWRKLIQPNKDIDVVFIGRHHFVPLQGQKESQPRFGSALVFFGFSDSFVEQIKSKVTALAEYVRPVKSRRKPQQPLSLHQQ